MTRKLKRSVDWELSLSIRNDRFISPPKTAQRNAILNRALNEFSDDLNALNQLAGRFVPGETITHLEDRTQGDLADEAIMEDWQFPIMARMAELVTEKHGDVLEVGFGRGISATMIQQHKVQSHTIIECNDSVVDRFHEWKELFPTEDIRLKHALWQDCIEDLGDFDGIFFHTYPLNMDEYQRYVQGSITFAGHFFPEASKHLRPGGVFTYFSNEIDSLSRGHQRLIFQHFSSYALEILPLDLPMDVKDTWWADSIAIVKAVK